jgi:hypothetical protein
LGLLRPHPPTPGNKSKSGKGVTAVDKGGGGGGGNKKKKKQKK